MKTKNIRHEIFIKEMITHGNRVQAYQTAYPGTSVATATTNASRLMKNEDICTAINEGIAAVKDETLATLKELYANKMLSIHQKRIYLARLVRGEAVLPRKVRRGCIERTEYRVATVSQMLRGIVMDCRLANMQDDDIQSVTSFSC